MNESFTIGRRTARRVCTLGGVLGLIALPSTARAVDIDWDNTSGNSDWNTPTNWSTDQVPTNGTPVDADATFINAAAGPANITVDIPSPRDIKFGSDAGGLRPGAGTVNQTGGNAALQGWFRMGLGGAGSGGTYNLSGGTLSAGRFNIAESGGATGTVAVSGNGTLRQNDTDLMEPSWSRIGDQGTATFNLSGNGTVSMDSRVLVGAAGSGNATITQTGGLFEVRRHELVIADTGTAVYNISAGTLRTPSTSTDANQGGNITVGQWDNSNGTLNVSGTAQVTTGLDLNVGAGRLQTDPPNPVPTPSRGTVNQTGGTVTVGRDLNIASGNASQTGSYTLSGGTLDLTGGTIRRGSDDTFVVSGTGRLVNVGAMEFDFAQAGGTFNPGPGPGTGQTNTNGYNLAAPGTLQVDITAPTGTDLLNVNGAVTLAGVLDIVPIGTFTANQSFTILQNDGADPVTGAFSNAPPNTPFLDSGTLWRVNYAGGDGNDVVVTVVPEPSVLGLAAVSACGLLLRRRRRSAR